MKKRVLVIQLARLGDLAQSLPLLLGLKHAGCRVDLVCGIDPGDWLRERLDALLVLDPRTLESGLQDPVRLLAELRNRLGTLLDGVGPAGWDHLVCLNDAPPATELARLLPARERHGAGVAGDPFACWLAALAETREQNLLHLSEMMLACLPWVQGQVTEACQRNSRDVIIHPGSGSRFRQLDPAFWRGLLRELALALPGHRLLLTGAAGERVLCESLAKGLPTVRSLAGRTDLDELLGHLEQAALVIAQDTGVLHLAAATSTPVLGLYHGSARALETGPFQHGAHVMEIQADCHPCREGKPVCAALDCRHWLHFHDVSRTALAILRGETPPAPEDSRVTVWRCTFDQGGWLLRSVPDGNGLDHAGKLAQLRFLRGEPSGEPLVQDPRAWQGAVQHGTTSATWHRREGLGQTADITTCAAHWKAAVLDPEGPPR
jgi:ADP-heptose:LPS heptosyltransferase